ncbi:hypothetical protein [Nostoc sp. CMAA1605]|nr:hypothetical protein [Nostoc sp. CMAA1605]
MSVCLIWMGDNLARFKEIGVVGSHYRLNVAPLTTHKTQHSALSTHHF